MFFEYVSPEYFYQNLHNQLATAMFKTGQLFGFFSIKIGSDGQTITRGSKALLIWSNFVSVFQAFGINKYLIYYMTSLNNEQYISVLSFILEIIQNIIFVVFILVSYIIVIFSREYILKTVIFAKNLKNLFTTLEIDKDESCQKVLLFVNSVNIAMGLLFVTAIAIMLIISYFLEPSLIGAMALIFETSSWAMYSYVIIIYCISLSFGFYLLRKIFDNLSLEDCHLLSICHYLLLKFLRKINVIMQIMLVVLVLVGFIGLVSDVSSDFIQNWVLFLNKSLIFRPQTC